MSIFTKLKTATDFSASVIKEGFALIWPEKKSDGSVALQVKLEDGSVQEIGGGSAGDIDAAVHIYDATVESSTGVVTITDGTPVSDLAIGDEIRTPDGVYQKVKDDITTGSIPDDGSHILVSGCTDPTDVNGIYVATGEPNIWKNETSNNWISRLDGYGGPWWFIASSQAPSNPGDTSIRYRALAKTAQNPWDANFTPSNAVGALSVQKYSDLVSKTDTIDLFEYATFPEDGAKTSDITDDIATHNADTSAHPDKLPLTGGQMTGELKLGSSTGMRFNNADGYGVIFRKDDINFYIMVTAQDDENGSWTASRPLQIDLATGDCYINGGATKDSHGNVITTTYAPLSHPAFSQGVEILGTTPYIDFHYNNSESDYTFRIVQNSEDTLTLGGKVNVSDTLTVTSGGMSVAGNIKNTGEIQSETTNSYRLVFGNYGAFWRNDGRDLYLMLTDSGDQYGVYNSLRPLIVDLPTGICDISGSALETESYLSSTGVYPRVSMNTTATADFNTFKTQGNYWFAFGVRPNGPLGDTAETTGVLSVYNIQNTHMLQVYNMYSGTSMSTQQMYYRWCYNDTWTSWARVTTAESIGTTTNDYNSLTEPGDYYLSFGDNISNLNAPWNGPFHVMVHRYQNSAGTAKPILQIAASQIVSDAQTPMMFFRSASYSDSAWTFQPWLKLLTEKDIKYVTGSINTGIGEEKDDYIVIGNCVIFIGQIKTLLPVSSGNFYLPISASNVTIMMSLAKMDSNAKAPTSIACDYDGTYVTYKIDGELTTGYVYINWIGIGYLN